jgi:oligopeptide/dipeptide ABC transporter ATP-binding protein
LNLDHQTRPTQSAGASSEPLLEIRDLSVGFVTEEGRVLVLEDVLCRIGHGQIVGLVGESGCGKSVTAMTVMRLLPSPPSFVDSGRILFDGRDLLALSDAEMRRVRGNQIGMIFQEPMTSLNPTFTIGYQLAEVMQIHRGLTKSKAFDHCVRMIEMTGIGAPQERMRQYPHQLSGGLRQRVMIAMALACDPRLLIADEPTTALDVTVQAQILELLTELKRKLGMSILMITHDLAVVAEFCGDVYVMYAGRVVEHAPVGVLFKKPLHPYTRGLLTARPRIDEKREFLPTIPGIVPSPGQRVGGCYFLSRCGRSIDRCQKDAVELVEVESGHHVACWNHE